MVHLTEDERKALHRAGDHHPDLCDCSAYVPDDGYQVDERACDRFIDTCAAVEGILIARLAKQEATPALASQHPDVAEGQS